MSQPLVSTCISPAQRQAEIAEMCARADELAGVGPDGWPRCPAARARLETLLCAAATRKASKALRR